MSFYDIVTLDSFIFIRDKNNMNMNNMIDLDKDIVTPVSINIF